MPASSLYCSHKSVSRISAAARKRRIAASPWVIPPLLVLGAQDSGQERSCGKRHASYAHSFEEGTPREGRFGLGLKVVRLKFQATLRV